MLATFLGQARPDARRRRCNPRKPPSVYPCAARQRRFENLICLRHAFSGPIDQDRTGQAIQEIEFLSQGNSDALVLKATTSKF